MCGARLDVCGMAQGDYSDGGRRDFMDEPIKATIAPDDVLVL
jgi:hypothetical protein